MKNTTTLVTGACLLGLSVASPSPKHISFDKPLQVEAGSLHNIHLSYPTASLSGEVHIVHGSCDLQSSDDGHHTISKTIFARHARPERLVWTVPEDVIPGGCLHAFVGETLVGRSDSIRVDRKLRKRESIADVADTLGPWFEGVAYMKNKTNTPAVLKEAKSKKIAILGGGMAGLFTSLLLESVGMKNWHITESSKRIGGRIRTKYLNGTIPEQYQYQEMGPMRFPVSISYADTNETFDIQDHKMVFQLADTLNKMNADRPDLAVNFIKWIQSSPNTPANSRGVRLADGRIPNAAEIKANATLLGAAQVSVNATAAEEATTAAADFLGFTPDKIRELATNMYKAHKEAVAEGHFTWSESTYLRYALNYTANITDFAAGPSIDPFWDDLYDNTYFSATTWRTIDKGLESLPRAFAPFVKGRITYGRKIDTLQHNATSNRISIGWRDHSLDPKPKSQEYDYAIVAVPFTKVRLWRTPAYSSLLSRAISTMNYQQSCKIALHYRTRFWEHLPAGRAIIGGCGSVDIPGIGSVCYPSYTLNATGPGVILASYTSGTISRSLAALSEADHVALAQRAMVEAHGQIAADEFTGNYNRQCWEVDEHQAGAWADPVLEQQPLFLPAYYQTEFKTVFIGEHTSYTHAWIFSALDSAVRGTAQVLLDLGLVDEAKEIVNTWMGRWIDI